MARLPNVGAANSCNSLSTGADIGLSDATCSTIGSRTRSTRPPTPRSPTHVAADRQQFAAGVGMLATRRCRARVQFSRMAIGIG